MNKQNSDEVKHLRERIKELESKEVGQVKTIEELKHDKAFIDNLLNTAQAIVLVLDTEGRIVHYNPYTEAISGYKLEEVLGEYWFNAFLPAGEHGRLKGIFQKAISDFQAHNSIIPMITKDDREVIIEWYYKTLKDIDGKITGLLAIGTDITKRKRTEEALMESEEKYRTLFESSADGILIADIETKQFKYANPAVCRILGYPEKELKQLDVTAIHPKENLEYVISEFEAQAKGEKTLAENIPCLKKDSSIVHVDISTISVVIDGINCNVGFFRDITKRKQAEERLLHLNRVLGAIRDVNQLITREKDRDRLLQDACNILLSGRGYNSVWIALLDENEKLVKSSQAGLEEDFLPLKDNLKRGRLNECTKRALNRSGIVTIEDTVSECGDCPLLEKALTNRAMTIRLEHSGRIHGVISVSVPAIYVLDTEEHSLFAELAGDIAFALHNIELEENRKQAENRFKLAARMTSDLIYEWDIRNDNLEWFGDIDKALGYEPGEFPRTIEGWINQIHPEDLKKLANSVELHRTSTEPINEEYKVQCKNGSWRHWIDLGTPVLDNQGHPVKWIGACIDVTERKQSEEALRDSESKLRNIIEHSTNAFYSHTPEHVLTYMSPQAKEILGYEVDEVFIRWTEFTSDNPINEKGFELTERAIKTGKPQPPYELELIHKSGEKVWVEVHEGPVVVDGITIAIVGALSDITERKRIENITQKQKEFAIQLSEATDLKEALALSVNTAIQVSGMDSGGIYLVDEVTGDLKLDYSTGLSPEFVSNASHIKADSPQAKLVYKRNPVVLQHLELKVLVDDFRRKEGLHAIAVVPIVHEGEVIGCMNIASHTVDQFTESSVETIELICGQISGIIVRIRAEIKLRESEERYRRLFEDDLTGDYISTVEGRIITCNPAFIKIFGFSSAEKALSAPIKSLYLNSEERDEFLNLIRDKGKTEFYEKQLRKYDGDIVHIIENAVGVFDESGELIQIRGYVIDNTERKLLEEQLLQSQKMEGIGILAGGVAHDFNNLLTVIIGNAELALIHLNNQDPLYRELTEIKNSADRAADLTRQLLAFSRKQALQPKVIILNELIINLKKMLLRMIGEDVELNTSFTENLWSVKVDPGQIEQVIVNLVVNARDSMPRGGNLMIETQNVVLGEDYVNTHPSVIPGEYVMMAVSDSGSGMSEEVRSKIFDPFFTTKSEGKGTGLGLSTVYGIIKQSGGHVWVYSEEGQGTSFKIYFPRIIEEAVEIVKEEDISVAPSGTETVLVVEDEDAVRNLAVIVLKQQGYEVIEAESGGDACVICQKIEKPDLVITDVVMPHMSGTELIKKLQEIWDNVTVLYMSGYTENAIIKHGVLDSGIPYLQKPFRPIDFAIKVRDVLDKKAP